MSEITNQAAVQAEIARRAERGCMFDMDCATRYRSAVAHWCDACLLRASRGDAATERAALCEVLAYFPSADMLDSLDDDKRSGIRHCPPSSGIRIRDVRRWLEAIESRGDRPAGEGA